MPGIGRSKEQAGRVQNLNVRIESLIPGKQLGEIHALLVLVNFDWLYGYEPK